MAYATSNAPALVAQRVGASGGAVWLYKDGDDLATVIGADYISNGDALGMVAGDKVIHIDSTNTVTNELIVSSVTSGGAATLAVSNGGSGDAVSLTAATYAPTAKQSGTLFLLNRAAGITVTLPAPVVGVKYKFLIQTAVTSNDYGIDTDAATTFFTGIVQTVINASATTVASVADGATHVSMNQNGTTTGGLAGTYFELECISSTLWMVNGTLVGSGVVATPFA